jgi:hypothetical protein
MINAQELKAQINNDDIIHILTKLDAHIYNHNHNAIISQTICHHGDSPKLYYYTDTKMFHCYTQCSCSFDIIELVCRAKDYTFPEAINWICIQLNISNQEYGFENNNEVISDWHFIKDIKRYKNKKPQQKHSDYYDKNILNIFQK